MNSATDTRCEFDDAQPQESLGNINRSARQKVTISHDGSSLAWCQLQESHMFKVVIDGDDGGVDMRKVYERIELALSMRPRYKKINKRVKLPRLSRFLKIFHENGVYKVSDHDVSLVYSLSSWSTFASDVQQLRRIVMNTTCVKACSHRLNIMQERSRMFFLLNSEIEEKHNFCMSGGVFSKATKVDNSVLLSRSTDSQELLDFILDWYSRYPDAPLRFRDGTNSTLRELFQTHGVKDPSQLTVASLGWQQKPRSKNYDFSLDPSPLSAELRYSFLHLRGSCTPCLLQKRLQRVEQRSQYVYATEHSIPIYGTYANELFDIASVLYKNEIGPYAQNMWILEVRFMHDIPSGVNYPLECKTIQDQLDFIFLPLFKATLLSSGEVYSTLAWFMKQVGGFTIRTAANTLDADFDEKAPLPNAIPYGTKPSSLYYFYYMHANLTVLNSLRKRKGLNTFQFRCSGGYRTSHLNHLLGGYLLADVITRATEIMDYPVLQYLCGLHSVGLTVSPLHDHIQGIVPYREHPLPNFFSRCLNVTIATEAPLLFHHGSNSLIEEYGTAMRMFYLSFLDVTELARNSVVMSSFSMERKKAWLGEKFNRGVEGNQFKLSHVTNVRLAFREESWDFERSMLKDMCINRSAPPECLGLTRWHYLSNVKEVEYRTVIDVRVRFPRIILDGPYQEVNSALSAASLIARAIDMRSKYIWEQPNPWEVTDQRSVEADFQRKTDNFNEDDWTYAASDAVFISFRKNVVHAWPRHLPTLEAFCKDLKELKQICANIGVKYFAQKRLENLEHKFRLHLALNHANEAGTTVDCISSNRDIYQAVKVDTHIHMAAGMTGRQLLSFVLRKLKYNCDDIALKKGDVIHTLGYFLKTNGITENLTVDQLNVQADHTLFERFDNFNNKYNPMGNSDLRLLLLKTDNFMKGRYFAELIHDVFAQYSRDRHTYAENRVSIYGVNTKEWDNLALWFSTHGMLSKHNKWVIQMPRVYKVFRAQNVIGSFGQYLQNIFQPLWDVSLHPSEHPLLHHLLNHISSFDSVDNEATLDMPFVAMSPWAWTLVENPPYNYYLYYLYANIRTLNEFRASRGFSTFALRPHCGESGSADHLYGAFLCANSICHGINLRNDYPMQYLYYLSRIGLHVSPLSNNALFLRFLKNPFPEFFRRGLNVSLSTDDPLMFHQTQEPLIEEYSIAARVWDLSPNDLCEIARNSVLQCGFDYAFKRDAIGDQWYMSSSLGNDATRTHLSDIRVAFRFETYHTEMQILEQCSGRPIKRWMLSTEKEEEINEKISDIVPEKIIMSTHDQAMEIMLRDIESKREELRLSRIRIDALRRQQKSLVDNLTEVATRRQELQEQAERRDRAEALRYERHLPALPNVALQTSERATVQRLLRWRPMRPDVLRHTTELHVSLLNTRMLPQTAFANNEFRKTI